MFVGRGVGAVVAVGLGVSPGANVAVGGAGVSVAGTGVLVEVAWGTCVGSEPQAAPTIAAMSSTNIGRKSFLDIRHLLETVSMAARWRAG